MDGGFRRVAAVRHRPEAARRTRLLGARQGRFPRAARKTVRTTHLVWKFGTALALIVVALVTLVEIDYRVTAKTVIEGEVQRVAAAPFEGFIAASHVRAGDIVREGQN